MKKQILALLCVLTINGIAIADDTQIQLEAMDAERESVFKNKGSSNTYFSENCPKHFTFWEQAAQQGQPIAQLFLASCYGTGNGVEKDEVQAVTWYRKAAEQGNALAQTHLGFAYNDGKGTTKDQIQAVVWFRKAAEQGFALAQAALGNVYDQGRGITYASNPTI